MALVANKSDLDPKREVQNEVLAESVFTMLKWNNKEDA